MNDKFDTVPSFILFVSEIEVVSLTGVVRCFVAIDEKHGVSDVVFLTHFLKDPASYDLGSGRLELCMEQFARFKIDRGVQPILLVVESDHGFVDLDVIRTPTGIRL